MAAGSVELTAKVGVGGSNGQPSRVRLPGNTGIFAPGGLWGDGPGGAGYSGGGGYNNNANGGSNGNDGGQGSNSNVGGSGTWEDITAYQLSEFTLSPGQGGQSYNDGHYHYGGGGGGVLVGGSGPSRHQYQGEGYGGGGGLDGSNHSGLPGVILVEVV